MSHLQKQLPIGYNNNNKISYWQTKVFDVFVNDWTNLVRSFPAVFTSEKSIRDVIYSHTAYSELFTYPKLWDYSSLGVLNIRVVISNFRAISIVLRKNIFCEALAKV